MFEHIFYLLLATLLTGLLLHVILMRKIGGKFMYLAAFLSLNAAWIAVLSIFYILGIGLTLDGLVVSGVFLESFVLVYVFILVGVVHDSPTLAIVKTLMATEPDGLSEGGLKEFIASHPFVSSRIDALVTTGDVEIKEGQLSLTTRSKAILSVIALYEKLIRVDRETG